MSDRGTLVGLSTVLLSGIAAFFAFPDDLAFLTRAMALALLVLSLDLLTGFGGVASLGQAALFGAGAYAAGIASVNGLTSAPLLLLVGGLAGAVAGTTSGVLLGRARGLAQLVLSIALVQLAQEAANKARGLTGGSDGLSLAPPDPLFGRFEFDLYGQTAYWLALGLLLVVLALLRLFQNSPFGLTCKAIGADRLRVAAMGGRVSVGLIALFTLSGTVAGLGGALAAITTGVVGLDSLSFELSAEALVMLILGGLGTLWGALLGTFAFELARHVIAAGDPFHWLALVGAMLVALTLLLPRGLASLPRRLRGKSP